MFTRRLVARSVPVALLLALAVSGCDSGSDNSGSSDSSADRETDTPTASDTTSDDATSAAPDNSGPSIGETTKPSDDTSPDSTPTKAAAGDQRSVLSSLPGVSSAKCVTIGSKDRTLRSGNLAVGDFAQARQSYGDLPEGEEHPTVHMFVVPGDAKTMNGVTVTMTPTGSQGQAASVHSDAVQEADVWKYYPVDVPVPAPGTWKLVASIGQDRGCFVVTFVR